MHSHRGPVAYGMAGRSLSGGRVVGGVFALVLAGAVGFGVTALYELDRTADFFGEVVERNADAVVAAANMHVTSDRIALLMRDAFQTGHEETLRNAAQLEADSDAFERELRARSDDVE